MSVHLHVFRESRDCDSTYTRSWVENIDDPGGDPTWSDEHTAHDEAWSLVQPAWWEDYLDNSAKVRKAGDDYRYDASWRTDEGYVAVEVLVCHGVNCAEDEPTYSDSTAEAAGY